MSESRWNLSAAGASARSGIPPIVLHSAFHTVANYLEAIRREWIASDEKLLNLYFAAGTSSSGVEEIGRHEIRAMVADLRQKLVEDLDFVPCILPYCDPSLRDNLQRVLRLLHLDSMQRDSYGHESMRWRQTWAAMELDPDLDELIPKLRAAGDAALLAQPGPLSANNADMADAQGTDEARSSPDSRARKAAWHRIRQALEALATDPKIALVAVVADDGGDPTAFIRELSARRDCVHWQGTPIRELRTKPGSLEGDPAKRRLFAFGDPITWETFVSQAMRAGVMTSSDRSGLVSSVQGCGFDLDRWVWTLFEFGWRRLDSTPFRAERWVLDNDGHALSLDLARRVGSYAGWYYSEIGDAVSASIDVLDLLRILEPTGRSRSGDPLQDAEAANAEGPSISMAALRDMTGLENTALNRYAKKAKVQTARRGQRNFRYTRRDVCAILNAIIAKTGEDDLRAKCKSALEDLLEITK